jgi:protein-S-isoprenylcysteine O-methyltransferase Ste14
MEIFIGVSVVVVLFILFCVAMYVGIGGLIDYRDNPKRNVVKMIAGLFGVILVISLFAIALSRSKEATYEENVAKYGESCAQVIRAADEQAERNHTPVVIPIIIGK